MQVNAANHSTERLVLEVFWSEQKETSLGTPSESVRNAVLKVVTEATKDTNASKKFRTLFSFIAD
jgi:hypothetical protein